MFECILFLFGLLLGAGLTYFYFNKVHSALADLNDKYTRLVNLISEWQKKI